MFFPLTTFPVVAPLCGTGLAEVVTPVSGGAGLTDTRVAHNGALYCCIGNLGAGLGSCATTPDGTAWTVQAGLHQKFPDPGGPGIQYIDVINVGTNFVAATVGTPHMCEISADGGVSWAQHQITVVGNSSVKLCYNGAVLGLLASLPGANNFNFSGDGGVTWGTSGAVGNAAFIDVAWDPVNSLFCAIINGSRDTWTSPDFQAWTQHINALPAAVAWFSIVHNGNVLCAIARNTTTAATSIDGGVTWTARNIGSALGWIKIINIGTKLYAIARGSATTKVSIDDGATWSTCTLITSRNWTGAVVNQATALAVIVSSLRDIPLQF